jgi:phosphatidylglycerophosphate synthase
VSPLGPVGPVGPVGPLPAAPARRREIWTRLTVDPLADPLARVLSRRSWVTPDRVTAVALVLAVASAACFAGGRLRLGGALFLARFFADCVDGKVARAQGSSSARGALLDLAADVSGISLVSVGLGWILLHRGDVPAVVPLAFLASLVYYNWALAYRKQLARQLGRGDGGAEHGAATGRGLVGRWMALCERLHMAPLPWVLEAEITVLGLAPLVATSPAVGRVMLLGVGFYTVANLVNTRRLWLLAGSLDLTDSPSSA